MIDIGLVYGGGACRIVLNGTTISKNLRRSFHEGLGYRDEVTTFFVHGTV
jgi:hypothetical protein